jgi:hypothetical protein
VRKEAAMSDALPFAQIEMQFPNEWVLIEDPQTNDALEVQSGRVLAHSKDRDELHQQVMTLRPSRFAVLFTGTYPEDAVIIL